MPIVDGKYVAPTWVNGGAPAINATELNAMSGTVQENQENCSDLKSALYDTLGRGRLDLLAGVTWELGTINGTTGAGQTTNTRIRTIEYIDIRQCAEITFSIATGYKYAINVFKSDKTIANEQDSSYWKTDTKTFRFSSTAAYIRIVVADTSDGTANVSYGNNMTVVYKSVLDSDIAALEANLSVSDRNLVRIVEDNTMEYSLVWEQYGITGSDGTENTNASCIRTVGFTDVDGVDTLHVSVDLTDFVRFDTETSCVIRLFEYSANSASGFVKMTERNPAIGTTKEYEFVLDSSTKYVRIMLGDWSATTFPVSNGSRLKAFIVSDVPALESAVSTLNTQMIAVSNRIETVGYDAVADDKYHLQIVWQQGGLGLSDGTETSTTSAIRSVGFQKINSERPLYATVDLTNYDLKESGSANFRLVEYGTDNVSGFIKCTEYNPRVGYSTLYSFKLDTSTKYIRFAFADWAIVTMPISAGNAFIDAWITGKASDDTIFTRNPMLVENVFAGADYYRQYPYSTTPNKLFTLMMISDIHGDTQRMKNAIDLLNGCAAIDAGIVLGDVQVYKYDASAMAGYISAFNRAEKPFYGVMGNHDFRQYAPLATNTVTCEQATTYFLKALNSGSVYEDRGYGYVDFSTYKIRLIMLNLYDYPDDNDGTDYVYYGDGELLQQAQVTWLVDTLGSTPENFTVILAAHYTEPMTLDDDAIKQHFGAKRVVNGSTPVGNTGYMGDTIIADIVNAFINKTTLSKSYTYTVQGSITGCSVSADFSGRTKALFGCYICGHRHKDGIGNITGHADQIVYVNDTSCCSTPSNVAAEYSLYPRNMNGLSQDLITVLSIDTDNKMINLTRIGAHRTFFMDDNSCVNYKYAD